MVIAAQFYCPGGVLLPGGFYCPGGLLPGGFYCRGGGGGGGSITGTCACVVLVGDIETVHG